MSVIVINKVQFNVEYLQSITIDEAVEHFKAFKEKDVKQAWRTVNSKKFKKGAI